MKDCFQIIKEREILEELISTIYKKRRIKRCLDKQKILDDMIKIIEDSLIVTFKTQRDKKNLSTKTPLFILKVAISKDLNMKNTKENRTKIYKMLINDVENVFNNNGVDYTLVKHLYEIYFDKENNSIYLKLNL